MNNKILFGAIAVIVVVGFILVSNKKGGPEIAPQAIEQNPPATETATQAEEQTQAAVITITSSGFEPETVNIEAGTKVVWANKSGSAATVNSALHPTHLIYPPLNLNRVSDSESVSLVFDEQGTYKYHDHLNPTRTGTVVVE
ncbi:MAG: cupredoxin domain-containing protein [Patescibacteria group bacterium]